MSHPLAMFGSYSPHRHEFDPILQAWIYGGPTTPTFWTERHRELADEWCEYKGITREQGIKDMLEWQKQKTGESQRAVFVMADGTEVDIKQDILGQEEELDPAFVKLKKDLGI